MSIVVTLLIIYEYKSDLNLGIWASVFGGLATVTMLLFGRFYNKRKPKVVLLLCAFSSVFSLIGMVVYTNLYTIILYNIVFYTFLTMLYNLADVRLYDYSNTEPYKSKYNTEYFLLREVSLNIGRILGFVMLFGVAITKNMEMLKVHMAITTIAIILITVVTNHVSKHDEEIYKSITN